MFCAWILRILVSTVFLFISLEMPAAAGAQALEVAKNDTYAGIEYIKKVGQFRREYFATLDTLNAMANQEGLAEKCQSYVVYCLLAYMNELVSMADINAKAYVMTCPALFGPAET